MREEEFYDLSLNVKGCKNLEESFRNYVEVLSLPPSLSLSLSLFHSISLSLSLSTTSLYDLSLNVKGCKNLEESVRNCVEARVDTGHRNPGFLYRGTSLIKKRLLLGPYSRAMPRALR